MSKLLCVVLGLSMGYFLSAMVAVFVVHVAHGVGVYVNLLVESVVNFRILMLVLLIMVTPLIASLYPIWSAFSALLFFLGSPSALILGPAASNSASGYLIAGSLLPGNEILLIPAWGFEVCRIIGWGVGIAVILAGLVLPFSED